MQIKVTLKLVKTQTIKTNKLTNRSESAGVDVVVFLCFASVSGLFSSLQLLLFVVLARLPSDSHVWRGQSDCKLNFYAVETAAFGLIPLQSMKLQMEAGNKRNKQKLLVWNLKPCFSEKKKTNVFLHGDVTFELESVTLYLSWLFQMFMELNCEKKKDVFLWRLFCCVFNFWYGGYKLFSKLNKIYFFLNFPFLSAFCAVL